jgi:hypothetical protein
MYNWVSGSTMDVVTLATARAGSRPNPGSRAGSPCNVSAVHVPPEASSLWW